MKKAHKIGSIDLATIGFIHISFGLIFAKEFNSKLLWFESLGLFLMMVRFTNLILISNTLGKYYLYGIQIINCLCALFLVLVVAADPMLVGILALCIQVLNTFLSWFKIREELNCCSKYRLGNTE